MSFKSLDASESKLTCSGGSSYESYGIVFRADFRHRVYVIVAKPAVSIYKIGWGAEPTGAPPSTGPPDVPVKTP